MIIYIYAILLLFVQEKFTEAQSLLDPLAELWSAAAEFLEVALCRAPDGLEPVPPGWGTGRTAGFFDRECDKSTSNT